MKTTIALSLIACLVLTIFGYFWLFEGLMLAEPGEYTPSLIAGYLLMWPTLLAGYLHLKLTGANSIGLVTLMIAQLIGYLGVGIVLYYAIKWLKVH